MQSDSGRQVSLDPGDMKDLFGHGTDTRYLLVLDNLQKIATKGSSITHRRSHSYRSVDSARQAREMPQGISHHDAAARRGQRPGDLQPFGQTAERHQHRFAHTALLKWSTD